MIIKSMTYNFYFTTAVFYLLLYKNIIRFYISILHLSTALLNSLISSTGVFGRDLRIFICKQLCNL